MKNINDIITELKILKNKPKFEGHVEGSSLEIIIKNLEEFNEEYSKSDTLKDIESIAESEDRMLTPYQKKLIVKDVDNYDFSDYNAYIQEIIEKVVNETNTFDGLQVLIYDKDEFEFFLGYCYYGEKGPEIKYFESAIDIRLGSDADIIDELELDDGYNVHNTTELNCINAMLNNWIIKERTSIPKFIPVYKSIKQAIENYDENWQYLIFKLKEEKKEDVQS